MLSLKDQEFNGSVLLAGRSESGKSSVKHDLATTVKVTDACTRCPSNYTTHYLTQDWLTRNGIYCIHFW